MAKKRKFNKSKEWLIEQYVIFDRSRKEIAAECGLSEAGLKSLLAEFKILKNKFTIDKKELENLVNQKLSVEKIAKQLNCSETSVYRYLKKYNLNNLITYCKDCHFYKIHGYQRKEEKLQALQKSPELLETPEMDNQQPSIINTGSTTISNESTSKQMEVGDTLNSDDIV